MMTYQNPEHAEIKKSPSIIKEVIVGLSKVQKTLPAKLLYDKRGSEIFEKICLLEEYYPTRAETEILKKFANEITELIGPEALIVEPGSGAGDKIRYLLPHLIDPIAYIPIEISQEILARMETELAAEFPHLQVRPICGDFNLEFEWLLSSYEKNNDEKKVVFFPGSTIGNFTPNEALQFLKKISQFLDRNGALIIGVDLKKDPIILERAYNDFHGVTAEFNLNILHRLNRDVAANFKLCEFEHQAIYNKEEGRIEMHVVSKRQHIVKINESIFRFKKGESIHTENSYKYSDDEFTTLCAKAKLSLRKIWKDSEDLFGVFYFEKN